MNVSVPYTNLDTQWDQIKDEALPLIDKIMSSGKYLEHEIIHNLEQGLSSYVGSKEVVLVNSGTDALMLALRALKIGRGDEVITVPNSFIASVAAISHVGATPVIVDVGTDHLMDPNLIEAHITKNTKAIMPVHLEGKVCDMDRINEIANRHSIKIIEDAAQSFGSKLNEKYVGSLSDITCFSLHPLKNLNACGDGGFIAINNSEIAENVRIYRNHGQKIRNDSIEFGVVSRFDSIQAAILSIRLKNIDKVIADKRSNALHYNSWLVREGIATPIVRDNVFHSYHLYVIEIKNRDKIKKELMELGIDTRVHYPRLITDQEAYKSKFQSYSTPIASKQKERILSLPIHTDLTEKDIAFISGKIMELNDKYN